MAVNRRRALLAALALPAGCAIQPLPSIRGTAIPAPSRPVSLRAPVVGQKWTYRKLNFFNSSLLDTVQETVASVGSTIEVARQSESGAALPNEIHATWGQLLRDPAWDYPMNFEAPVPLWPAALMVDARSTASTQYRMDGGSFRFWIQVDALARGWERITVSAGTFDTLRIDRLMRLDHQDFTRAGTTIRRDRMWLAPEVGRWVARETSGEYREAGSRWLLEYSREDHFQWELAAWQ